MIKLKSWTPLELRLHKEAVARLERILSQAVSRVARLPSITEEKLSDFIISKMRAAEITSVLGWTIVAYGASAADPHYHFKRGKSRVIKPGHFLLLDIWGKLNRPEAPYADITQMYFVGRRVPERFKKLWSDLRGAREAVLHHLKENVTAQGAALHNLARAHLDERGHAGLFIHGLGHDLGHDHPHGPGINLSPKFPEPLKLGRGYTIEPGLYKKRAWGLRSEMDLFLTSTGRVEVTSTLQHALSVI